MKISLRGRGLEVFDVRNPRVFADEEIRDKLAVVKILDLAQNQITHVSGLQPFSSLTVLDLASNRIVSIRGLPLTLTRLHLAHNVLTSLDGLAPLTSLQYLDISHNQLYSLEGLPRNAQLQELICTHNRLATLHGLEAVSPHLRILNLDNNYIQTVDHLHPLEQCSNLRKISFIHNPVAALPSYFNIMSRLLPDLESVDGIALPRSALQGQGASRANSRERRLPKNHHVSFSDDASNSSTVRRGRDDVPRNAPTASPGRGAPPPRVPPAQAYVDPTADLPISSSKKPLPPPTQDGYSTKHRYATPNRDREEMRLMEVRLTEMDRILNQKTDRCSHLERENRRLEAELSNTRRLLAENMEKYNKIRSEHSTLTSMVTQLRLAADKNAKEFKHAHIALHKARVEGSQHSHHDAAQRSSSAQSRPTPREGRPLSRGSTKAGGGGTSPIRSSSARLVPSQQSNVPRQNEHKPTRSQTPPVMPAAPMRESSSRGPTSSSARLEPSQSNLPRQTRSQTPPVMPEASMRESSSRGPTASSIRKSYQTLERDPSFGVNAPSALPMLNARGRDRPVEPPSFVGRSYQQESSTTIMRGARDPNDSFERGQTTSRAVYELAKSGVVYHTSPSRPNY